MRSPSALIWTAVFAVSACSDDGMLDRGGTDGGPHTNDAAGDSGDGDGLDAGSSDRTPADGGEPFPCTSLDPTASPETPAALTGRLDITDYDGFDAIRGERYRTRNAGFNFFTQTMPVSPLSDGALFTAIARDACVAFDLGLPTTDLRPARNIGTAITLTNSGTVTVSFRRETDADGPRYRLATQADTVRFFDMDVVKLDDTWTWSTPGDAAARVRAASASVGSVEDFQVTPAFTATSAAAVLDPMGARIAWTPAARPGEMAIVLARALDPMGMNARYLVCRPRDDGEFTISAADFAAFAPIPGLAFDLAVSRSALGALCNEGVPRGAAVHTLVYLGAGVVP